MQFLQDLVPGCSKITNKAAILDEIITYVQCLQMEVEVNGLLGHFPLMVIWYLQVYYPTILNYMIGHTSFMRRIIVVVIYLSIVQKANKLGWLSVRFSGSKNGTCCYNYKCRLGDEQLITPRSNEYILIFNLVIKLLCNKVFCLHRNRWL